MSFLTATPEPVVSRARFVAVQGTLWGVGVLLCAALFPEGVSGKVALAVSFGSILVRRALRQVGAGSLIRG